MKGIRYDGKSFLLVDTNGDGNCLYHSIVASNKVNITDAGVLRNYIYEKGSQWINAASQEMDVVLKIYGALQDMRVTLHEFINRQRQSGQWGSTIDMAFAAIVLNVHICSISNKIKEFDVFTTKKFFEVMGFDDYIPKNAETVYIYHHAYGRPFDPYFSFASFRATEDASLSYHSTLSRVPSSTRNKVQK